MSVEGENAVVLGLQQDESLVVFVGNTSLHTLTTAVRILGLRGSYAGRFFNSLRGDWTEITEVRAADLARGVPVELDRQGFCLFELTQDV